jgi:hypothetical protein
VRLDVFHWFGCHHRTRLIPVLGPVKEQKLPAPARALSRPPHPFPYEEILVAQTMTDSQQTTLGVSEADKRGNPTGPLPAGTKVTFLVDNPNVLTLTPNPDGVTCMAASAGPLGTATVTVNVTNPDGSSGGTGSLAFTIIAGSPTQIAVTATPPTEQP